jgi:predicted alpha/beta superfamily hydrolase
MNIAHSARGGATTPGTNSMLNLELFTPNDDDRPVYIAGNFNDWKSRDQAYQMEKTGPGHYRYAFKQPLRLGEPLEYKYTKGGWESEELDADGFPPTNRRMEVPRGKVNDVVPNWKSHTQEYDPQFYPNIEIVAKRFNVPQLRRRRRISVLLPWDYYNSSKHYPVLYLQDGQNLFEDGAPFGTWGVDKQLAALAQRGKGDVIVVAIDHGGKDRIQEFSPYDTQKWGEGMGREYATFLAETLKPHIDSNYRTLPGREYTGIGGSSMGGLISIYAGIMYPYTFSKFMIFSPSLWISPKIYQEQTVFSNLPQTKVYLYAGGKEGSNMVPNSKKFKEMVESRDQGPVDLQFRLEINPHGTHNEAAWGNEFPKATEWLFYS